MRGRKKTVNVTGIRARLIHKLMKLSDKKLVRVYASLFNDRKFPRKKLSIPVEYDTRKESFQDVITNISAGGVFIETDEALNVGDEVSLLFSVSGPRSPFNITGKIVRRPHKGIGVEFTEIVPQQKAALASLIKSG
jgi:uncharacterized protein (TIGR02266 family)